MPKRLGERIVFQSKLFTIKDVELQFNEKKVIYQILEKTDSCGVIPITSEGKIIMVYEYVAGTDEYVLDFPGGRMEEGVDIIKLANKELQEETGCKARRIDMIGTLTLSPGYLTQKTHIVLARDLTKSKLVGDENEELKTEERSFEEIEQLIATGKITEARTIAGFYLVRKFLGKEKQY